MSILSHSRKVTEEKSLHFLYFFNFFCLMSHSKHSAVNDGKDIELSKMRKKKKTRRHTWRACDICYIEKEREGKSEKTHFHY